MSARPVVWIEPPLVDSRIGLTRRDLEWLEAFDRAEAEGLSDGQLAERECVALSTVRKAGDGLRCAFGLVKAKGGHAGRAGRYPARAALLREARDLSLLPPLPKGRRIRP